MKKIFLGLFSFWLLMTPSVFAQQNDDTLDDNRINIIGTELCERSIAQGGWGGTCKERGNLNKVFGGGRPCEDNESAVGLCNIAWDSIDQPSCCVAQGTEIANPTREQTIGLLTTTDYCESSSGMGGDCRDIDSANLGSDLRGIGVDSRDPTCATTNDIVVALCTDNSFWSWDGNDLGNGCCVPKNGPYCQQLRQESGGVDVCQRQVENNALAIQYGDYQLLEQIPGSSNTSGRLQPYLESLYKAGFVLIILGAIVMIGLGGFTYMASAGNTAMIKKGKGMITDAIIGLVVALLIWLILNIINPDLVNLQIDPLPGLNFDTNNSGATTAANNAAGEGQRAGGNTLPCQGGLVDIPRELSPRLTSSSQNKICRDMADKLLELERVTGLQIAVTSSVRTQGALSQCHLQGNADSGNCADIGLASGSLGLNDRGWAPLCQAVGRVSGLQLVNEAANIPECTQVAPFRQYPTSSGAHFHLKLIAR